MKMKHQIFFLFFLSFFVFNQAQNKEKHLLLNWNDSKTIYTSNGDKITIPIVENNFFDENFIPTYYRKWKVNNNLKIAHFKVTNVTYKNVSEKILHKKSLSAIPKELNPQFNIFKSRKSSFASIKINPLIKQNGIYKKITSFTLIYSLLPDTNTYKNSKTAHNSPLSNGTWFKFAVDTTGVYKISKSFLNNIGLSTANINPQNIKIYGNGGAMLPELNSEFRYDGLQENAIYVEGENDGTFNNDDYILFYAQGPDSWKYNPSDNKIDHINNIYSDKAYYFITVSDTPGKRIQNASIVNEDANTQNIYTSNTYRVHEFDLFNFDAIGQNFYGESFQINNQQSFLFNIPNIDTNIPALIKLKAGASSVNSTYFNLQYNSQDLINFGLLPLSDTTIASDNYSQANTIITEDVFSLDITYNNSGNPAAKGALDYIEINAIKNLVALDKQFNFRNFNTFNATNTFKFIIENKENIREIWDVTEFINPKKIENIGSGTNFEFVMQGGTQKEYVLVNNSDFYTPTKLQNSIVENQNLHALQDIDYLIIAPTELFYQAERLADFHQNNSGFTTYIVDPQTIYNEFSSGSQDLTAIRDFIRHLYLNASSNDKRIKYVLLFGDTSFDYKNIEGNNGSDTIIFAYESLNSTSLATSYVTDNFYSMMDDNEGDFRFNKGNGNLIDVFVGRLPVKDKLEAKSAINRILHYYSTESLGNWRNKITLVADDVDSKSYNITLEKKTDSIAKLITLNKPEYNLKKLYADAFQQIINVGGERYPTVKNEISNAVERGTLLLNYFGHGGENGWASERILDIDQIKSWYNHNSPLFITITCEFSRYDKPTRTTAGEYVFNNPTGGSVNMITTSREVYIDSGAVFNIKLITNLLEFNGTFNRSISEALAETKNEIPSYTQRLFISYFGDPAMKLPISKPNIKITEMNNMDINQSLDTIKALSHNYFKGIITDSNDNIIPSYNGELFVEIYDKSIKRYTLNNDNFPSADAIMEFDSRESKIFNGKVSVINGQWEFDFIAPRDIRIAYGTSKLSFYSDNNTIDKMGYNTDIIIGGIDENAPIDDIGPTVNLYMNDESFIDGGNTNQSPLFLAVLEDESGINTSTTAVDHDIIAILDGDVSNPINMNDYYETELNDFTKGKVKFPFRNLATGLHTITFKCWDTYNNSSEATLNFVVVSDTDLVLDHVLNYPNPFINYTEFWFSHNKPNEPLEVQIQIFTISGKLIKTINQNITTTGTLSRSITWDGLDDFGNKIGKGVYLYKLNVKTTTTNIKAEKFEKLVILQ